MSESKHFITHILMPKTLPEKGKFKSVYAITSTKELFNTATDEKFFLRTLGPMTESCISKARSEDGIARIFEKVSENGNPATYWFLDAQHEVVIDENKNIYLEEKQARRNFSSLKNFGGWKRDREFMCSLDN